MAKAAKKTKKKKDELTLDEAAFFKWTLLAALVLCGLVYGSSFRGVFLGEFGLYANLAVLFYLLAFGFAVKAIGKINLENWDKWCGLAVLALVALVMAAEELRWGLPFLSEDSGGWRIQRIRDLVSVALIGIPDGATLWLSGVIAGTRLLMVLTFLYAAGFAIYFRARLPQLWKKTRAHPAFLYACFFLFFLTLMIFLTAEMPVLFTMLGAYLRMGAALAFLMGVLQLEPKTAEKA